MSTIGNNNDQNAQQAGSSTTSVGGGATPVTQRPGTSKTTTTTPNINGQGSTTTTPTPSTGTSSTSSPTVVGPSAPNTLANPTRTAAASSASSAIAAPAATSNQAAGAGDDDMGVSTGALAGAIVGSIIGAAIITFLVTWFFFGKRNKRDQRAQRSEPDRSRSHRSGTGHGAPKAAGAGVAEKSSSSSGDSGFGWQAYLPQSADDNTVQRDVKTLFDQIELHVDNYYTKANVRVDSGTREALSLYDEATLPTSIESLIANPQTTLPTIKHCIAKVLIARMSPGFEDGASLLPAYLTSEPAKLKSSSMPPGESNAVQQAYSQWRLLNAYLNPQPEKDKTYQQRREQAAREISEQLSTTFALWQGPKENLEGLKQHEKSLVVRAGDVGCLIMSQPSAYDFRWNASHSTSGRSFVVFPGFTKTMDERGRPLEQQQSLVSPVISRA